jgi:uncharacterized membrane protein
MTLFDFILSLGFWQWVGVLLLCQALGLTIIYTVKAIASFRFVENYATWQTWNNEEKNK